MALVATLTVAIAGFLLSLSGVPVSSSGDYIYVTSARSAFQVQVGVLDWAAFLLSDVLYVFALWAFVTVRGGQLGTRQYVVLAGLGFLVSFLGNVVKVFAEVYVGVTSGILGSGYDSAPMVSLDSEGLFVMFGILLLAVVSTCFVMAVGSVGGSRWPFRPEPAKTL